MNILSSSSGKWIIVIEGPSPRLFYSQAYPVFMSTAINQIAPTLGTQDRGVAIGGGGSWIHEKQDGGRQRAREREIERERDRERERERERERAI